jgi:hypothetical protein
MPLKYGDRLTSGPQCDIVIGERTQSCDECQLGRACALGVDLVSGPGGWSAEAANTFDEAKARP